MDAAVVRDMEILVIVSEFLGVQPSALESTPSRRVAYKTKLVKKELCTVFLDPDGASDNRDDLAKIRQPIRGFIRYQAVALTRAMLSITFKARVSRSLEPFPQRSPTRRQLMHSFIGYGQCYQLPSRSMFPAAQISQPRPSWHCHHQVRTVIAYSALISSRSPYI
jgi:hypothetical protein